MEIGIKMRKHFFILLKVESEFSELTEFAEFLLYSRSNFHTTFVNALIQITINKLTRERTKKYCQNSVISPLFKIKYIS